ncbi:hypothetical protein MUP77_06395 [Candidatus Bathyarchaeota archaeon]|nr:hypothetical protein [Candidatus Bathyarchaeota archaeon]
MFKEPVIKYNYVETEYRGHSGDSDYVISGTVRLELGYECVKAYVWELKAPQCYIFEKDNENRVCPTKDLIRAENQLLHYFHENRGSEEFRKEFSVTHSDDVCLGGIIIGKNSRRVSGEYEEDKRKLLYEKAISIRNKYFYVPNEIRLMTWDNVLENLKARTETSQQFIGKEILNTSTIPLGSIPVWIDDFADHKSGDLSS